MEGTHAPSHWYLTQIGLPMPLTKRFSNPVAADHTHGNTLKGAINAMLILQQCAYSLELALL